MRFERLGRGRINVYSIQSEPPESIRKNLDAHTAVTCVSVARWEERNHGETDPIADRRRRRAGCSIGAPGRPGAVLSGWRGGLDGAAGDRDQPERHQPGD